jgi:hypothetical protein
MALSDIVKTIVPPDPKEQEHGSKMHITIYLDGGTWKVKDHTDATPAFASLTDQTQYIPPMQVRGVNIYLANNSFAVLNYDNRFRSTDFRDISEPLATTIIHPIWASKIRLSGSTTTATEIHLHG